jgi:CheY-like chemotaxis protein
VLEAMRHEEAWRDIPVIVITAKDLDHEELARLNGRAERVFQKGAYDRVELVGVVHGMIARRIAERRLRCEPVGGAA